MGVYAQFSFSVSKIVFMRVAWLNFQFLVSLVR